MTRKGKRRWSVDITIRKKTEDWVWDSVLLQILLPKGTLVSRFNGAETRKDFCDDFPMPIFDQVRKSFFSHLVQGKMK